MNIALKFEYAALVALSLVLFSYTNFAWWVYGALFLVPDIGMVGYLVNPRIGSITYNLTHYLWVAVALYLVGYTIDSQVFLLAGSVMLGHSAFDRVLGFGLKYPDSFKHTHLGNL